MKRFILILLILLIPAWGWGATTFTDGSADHKWSTVGNWSDGKPDSADAVTVGAGVTSIIVDEAASVLSFDTTVATGNVAISGTGTLAIAGDFTLGTGDKWTVTGTITVSGDSTFTTAGVTLEAAVTFSGSGKTLTLADALNIGNKALTVTEGTLASGNNNITCGVFSTSGSGTKVLSLGSSTVACLNMNMQGSNLTITENTAAVNITISGTNLTYFGGKIWGGTVKFIFPDDIVEYLMDSNTFGNLTIDFSGIAETTNDGGAFSFRANQTVSGIFSVVSYCDTTVIHSNKPWINTAVYEVGTSYTITVNGSVSVTNGAVDFRDITGAGTASWDLSAVPSGDCGGNSGITFRSPQMFYVVLGNLDAQFYGNGGTTGSGTNNPSYATTSGGVTSFANIPLPQDTLVIDNNTWGEYTGHTFFFHYGTRVGNVDASGLTNSGNKLGLPGYLYGNIDFSGSGATAYTTNPYGGQGFYPRLKNELGEDLTVNLPNTFNSLQKISIGGQSADGGSCVRFGSGIGTVKLLSNISVDSMYLCDGTLDLNGKTVSVSLFNSSSSYSRTIKDTAGGGKIVLNGLTGTLFDTTTATNLTVSNAPDIDIGDSNNTLTGDVTFIGSGKTYGDFTVKKHAGDFDAIITGANTFGALTLETPDDTYAYSDLQLTSATDNTITSLEATGTATHTINLKATTGGSAAKLSDTTGINTVSYCTIQDITVEGGAIWNAEKTCTDVSGNTGWTWLTGGGKKHHPKMPNMFRILRIGNLDIPEIYIKPISLVYAGI